ncbi:MAG: GxxExxY protein [Pirellulaceae bacterium]|nr:GxxExxY protein [Pirellulaceae bacterium]
MPIVPVRPVRRLSQDEFRKLDYRVMGVAFEVHNDLGRHLAEELYKNELAHRLRREGVAAEQQFPIRIEFAEFKTTLWPDLLIADAAVYELKAAAAIAPAHRAQALGYVLLTETSHGKLLNFGTAKVEGEFISASLTLDDRREFTVDESKWLDLGLSSRQLKSFATELARDWGLCLACSLYREAIVYFLGGEAVVKQRIELSLADRVLGSQEVDLLDPETLLVLTAIPDEIQGIQRHFQRLLNLSRLKHLQWINFQRHCLQFVTLAHSL